MEFIQDYLKSKILLFDGGMGTYLNRRYLASEQLERANLEAPDLVSSIHEEYLQAGAQALKTNTFGCSRSSYDAELCLQLVRAGWELANRCAKDEAYVFADIGPAGPDVNAYQEYCFLADAFLRLGAKHFLFETNSSDEGIAGCAAYIKGKMPDAFILVSIASLPDGFTRAGIRTAKLLRRIAESPAVDAVGLNCVCGAAHMKKLVQEIGPLDKPLSVMPNAGYPTVLGNRTFYSGSPDYYALQVQGLAEAGAAILGGCCGTTPAHIAAVAAILGCKEEGGREAGNKTAGSGKALETPGTAEHREQPEQSARKLSFWESLCDPAQKPIAVELDSPEVGDLSKFMRGARELQESGAAILTIADCPVARARMDSSILACKIRRDLQMEALPHMTCRDRNINATKALLLGLCAEDVHYVLAITGDPIPSSERDEVKSVFNFNSRKLAAFITSLAETSLPVPFQIFGALNINALNFDVQIRLAKEKEANGMCGFFTQPVLTEAAFENLKRARQELNGRILGGIMPVVSKRNALFMANEMSGINVAQEIIDLYDGADRARGEELAVAISTEIAKQIHDYVDGYYIMTPFGRTGLVSRIMKEIQKL